MAKKRKNLGKVKRYRHSFHTSKAIVLNVVLWIVIVVGVGAGGYFVAPAIIDFGTSTWYALTDGIGSFGASSAASEPEPTASATPEPTPMPTEVAKAGVVDGTWADVSLSALTSAELIDQTTSALAAQGVTYVVVPLKDTSGYIHYASSVDKAAGSIASNCVDAEAIATAITEAGMIPVASLVAFQDALSVYQDREMGIRYQESDYMWLDNTADAGGKAWMNPYSDLAVSFIGDLVEEVAQLGYTQVVLSQVQFPAQVSSSQNFGSIGSATRADALRSAIATWDARFADQDMILWYEYDYETCVTVSNITGELPSSLGIANALINLPLATDENPDPDTSALAEIVSAWQAGGSEYIVVAENGTADFYEKK
ncbi:MAG: putative glycoside hydrolase [Faecalibacterium sp.]